MEDGSRQVGKGPEEATCWSLRDSTCLGNCSRGSSSVLLLSLFLRSKSNQAGPWFGCDHQGKRKEKGKKTTKDEALGCIHVQMTGRGRGVCRKTEKEGPEREEEKEERQFFLKNPGKGKFPVDMLTSLESHHIRGGPRCPGGKAIITSGI